MQEIFSLLKSLTTGEWASFQNYLACFSTYCPEQLKQLQLARVLMEAGECPEERFCRNKVYGRQKDSCFDALKSRLKEKTLDFLLTDISADKQQELDEADYMMIKIKKKSAQFQQLYYSKKRIPLFYSLIDEIIALAKKYEQYFILVEYLRHKKNLVSWKNGKEEFEKINTEMEYYWNCNRMVNKAEHYYFELIMMSEYSGKPDDKKLSVFFEKAMVELEDYYEQTKSPLIKYHRKFLELGFYQHCRNYSKARSVCLELLEVVRNNKSVYRRQRRGVVYDNLSRCELYLAFSKHAANTEEANEHIKHALHSAREAQNNFNLHSENYCIALEQEFYALFAMRQYDPAAEVANRMLISATKKELGEFRFSKYNYLLANALFKLGRHNEALQILLHKTELSKDKTGWETGARILKIMTLIETLKLDQASNAVFSLKKFFSRTEGISPRDKKILNLFLLAERKGFMFPLLNEHADKYFFMLSAAPLRWEPFTPEVIPFHEWFAGKMKRPLKSEFAQKYEREKEFS